MKLLPELRSDRGAREKWEAGLAWFRLRYQEPTGPTRCLKLLSRPEACGRIALIYEPGVVSRLYLGIPERHVRLLHHMAGDFGFSLKSMPPAGAAAPIRPLVSVTELPWHRPFVAQVVGGEPFVALVHDEKRRGAYLPKRPARPQSTDWRLPAAPPPGLAMRPYRNGHRPPAHLVAAGPDPRRWPVGRSLSGAPLHVEGSINVYGRREAVADWLLFLVTQTIQVNHANLVVIDGAGDLVPRLKRKPAVTRLLGVPLAYVDIDSAYQIGGFNPLAAVPREPEEVLLRRWQRWFRGMNVTPQGVDLLAQARHTGVEDIPGLEKWLRKAARQEPYAAVSSLGLALSRLKAERTLREWLEWPKNCFELLPAGALFFACRATTWGRRQLLWSVPLAGLSMPNVRLVVHGFPWSVMDAGLADRHKDLVVGNGPRLADGTPILVESRPRAVTALARRFLGNDARLAEDLALLRRGEGLIVLDHQVVFTTWRGHSGGAGDDGREGVGIAAEWRPDLDTTTLDL